MTTATAAAFTTLPAFADLRAGKAELTVSNGKGEHVTFRISAPSKTTERGGRTIDRDANVRFVSVMSGLDRFVYVGLLDERQGIKPTKGSKLPTSDRRVAAVAWVLRQVAAAATLPAGYELAHAGKCLRCGRKLTNPDSIASGIGPECRNKENESKPLRGSVPTMRPAGCGIKVTPPGWCLFNGVLMTNEEADRRQRAEWEAMSNEEQQDAMREEAGEQAKEDRRELMAMGPQATLREYIRKTQGDAAADEYWMKVENGEI